MRYDDVIQDELRSLHSRTWSAQDEVQLKTKSSDPPHVLVDGVFFQLAQTGIARLWASILAIMAEDPGLRISLLDRGNAPDVPGINKIPFSTYKAEKGASSSLLLNQTLAVHNADVFVSTYYTTPTTVPSVLLVYDMIPEIMDFDLSEPSWREKDTAICFARRYLCISQNTKEDLLRFYPNIPNQRVSVAHCGLDRQVFFDRGSDTRQEFCRRYGLKKPYFLLVGSRGRRGHYKNASLFFDAVKSLKTADFDIVCTGGERELDSTFLDGLPTGIATRRLELTDDELAMAYSGALALVYPSLYEGFGMPAVEAMACGCPVITTNLGSLKEVAGNAAILVSGSDVTEMANALHDVRDPAKRSQLIRDGIVRSSEFNWEGMASATSHALKEVAAESNEPNVRSFLKRWKELRTVQSAVQIGRKKKKRFRWRR